MISLTDLKPGDVIKINDFKLQNKGGKDKPVWMLFLGMDSILDCPIYIHLHRHTTKLQYYEKGGCRETHIIVRIDKKQYNFFDEDCILDFNELPYPIEKNRFENVISPKSELVGSLKENTIREICKCIKQSPHYSNVVKASIRSSLNKNGITGINF